LRFELFIATRYLRAKNRNAVIGVVTAISVLGVAVGVASLIIALAITGGMRQDLQERLIGSTSHVTLMKTAGDGMKDWRPLLARLRKLPHVLGAAPGFYGQVLISRNARGTGGIVKGIDPTDERTVSELLQAIKKGSPASLTGSSTSMGTLPPIVIGNDLAETVGVGVGDKVTVTSPQGAMTPFGMIPRFQYAQVTGIFHAGFYQYDSGYALMRLSDVQRLFSEPDEITVISFKLDDLYKAHEIGAAIESAAGRGFQTTNWMEQNRELFTALRLEQIATFIVLALIVCVAALNILIALTMLVMEKGKDIAVMMSFGVTAAQVRRIFLFQGLLISLMGTTIGLVVGFGLSWAGGHYRLIGLSAAVYSLDYLPFSPRIVDSLIVAAVSLGISALATLYPSAHAANVMPAESLRYE